MGSARELSAYDVQSVKPFAEINRGYARVFAAGELTIGLVAPIESYASNPVPSLEDHLERAQLVESLGFAAVWLRDVPFNVPSFGDAGQLFDPFVYLGALATSTSKIALGVASIVLTLRHPAHVAKAAHTADVLSGGRLLLGIASGDRPEEFPALGLSYADRGARFRDAYTYIRAMAGVYPQLKSEFGEIDGRIDMLPKPAGRRLPLLITGSSQQSPDWIARHGDGWMTYPRQALQQQSAIQEYRARSEADGEILKPVMEPLYIDLAADPNAAPRPIHLGLSLGVNELRKYLASRQAIGVNHVALNLRFNQGNTTETLKTLAGEVLPHFATKE